MAIRRNVFSGTDKKTAAKQNEKKALTADEVRNIVSREVNTVSAQSKIMKYFDELEAQGVRTEALLGEIREAIDDSISQVKEAAAGSNISMGKLEEIDASVKKVEQLSMGLENTVHKDNLLSYKNIKDRLEELEENSIFRAKKIRRKVNAAIVFGVLNFIGIIGIVCLLVLQMI